MSTFPRYIVTATGLGPADWDACDWRVESGRHGLESAWETMREFIEAGYTSVHIRDLGDLIASARNGVPVHGGEVQLPT